MINTILFERYKVISFIGSGSYANVYLVEHLKLKALRAMKQINKAHSDMPSFQNEAHLLQNLNHPGIPIIYDYEEDETSFYIFEEFIKGESLEEFISQHKHLSMEQMLSFSLQLCSILGYLHRQKPYPIIYQDFKPEHIYVVFDRVKLLDFGLADFESTSTHAKNRVHGTNEYCAPEKRINGRLTIVSDIFGIGKILMYLFEAVVKEKQSAAVLKIIEKAVHKDHKERFQSMEELEEALKKVKTDEILLQKKVETHLKKTIAIGSSQSKAGATHFAIALSSYLKFHEENAYFPDSKTNEIANHRKRRFFSPDWRKRLKRIFGAVKKQKEEFQIEDYGAEMQDLYEFLKADQCIVMIGTRSWELENSYELFERFFYCEKVIFVCNWGDKKTAKKIAQRLSRRVYCFPLDENPYVHTKEKERFFSTLRKKEGW